MVECMVDICLVDICMRVYAVCGVYIGGSTRSKWLCLFICCMPRSVHPLHTLPASTDDSNTVQLLQHTGSADKYNVTKQYNSGDLAVVDMDSEYNHSTTHHNHT